VEGGELVSARRQALAARLADPEGKGTPARGLPVALRTWRHPKWLDRPLSPESLDRLLLSGRALDEAGTWFARCIQARRLHREALEKWCRDNDLLDQHGNPDRGRLRPLGLK
jgi:hypothetical protein